MKRAVQAIAIASDPQMKINVMTEFKTITIREGHRDYSKGPVVLFDEKDSWLVKAEIYEIKWGKLSDVTEPEWKADGFTSQEDMLLGMREFYPEMTLESPVTVVKWHNASGFWTEIENIEKFAENFGVEAVL